jgi:hypothetical protein
VWCFTIDARHALRRCISAFKRITIESSGWIDRSYHLGECVTVLGYLGSIEAFYEGWHFRSFWMNLELTAIQYLAPVLLLMGAAIVAVLVPRWGH